MKKLMEIVEEIKGITAAVEDFEDEIVIAFGDYEYNGVSEIILSKQNKEKYYAYASDENAPQITIIVNEENGIIEVMDVYAPNIVDFESMIGKKWSEVKNELTEHIYVDTQNVYLKTGDCIVDFSCCPHLSIIGTYNIENDEIVIQINDNALIYDNRG